METSHTSSGSAESRLIHLHGRGLFPNLGRGRRVERGPAKAPETIEHEGKRMTQREVMAEKEKKMEELREKAKKAKEAKDALKKKIEQKDHDSPFPDGYNYAHDADALKILEKEIANLEQKVQQIDKTSWRTAMNAVKDAEQAHDEILNNIYNADNQVAESGELDAERNERRTEYMAQADEQFNWVQNNLEGKTIDVQYMNVSGEARIGSGAKQLIERAKAMEALANTYDALKGKISRDENFISRLRTAAQKCRDLFPAMNEHEQGIMKMQKQNTEKQKELAPRVQAWKQNVETFRTWNKLDARVIANDPRGAAIVEDKIREGLALQAEYKGLSSVLDGTDAALNNDISTALPQLENLKTQVKQLIRAEKQRKVLEPIQALQGISGADVVNVLGGESRSALEKIKGMIKDLEGVAQEVLNDGVRAASPEAQALVAPMNELKRIQTEVEGVMGIEHQEREQNDRELVEGADKLMKIRIEGLDASSAVDYATAIEALIKVIDARLTVTSPSTSAYPELQRMSLELGTRLDAVKRAFPALRGATDAAPDRVPDGMWVNFRNQRAERLNAMAKDKIELANNVTDPDLRARLLEDAAYFKQKANDVYRAAPDQFRQEVVVERTSIPNIRTQLEQAITTLENPGPTVSLPPGMAASWQLGVAAFNALMRLNAPQQIAQLKRQLAALPTDLGTVPDMA